MNATAEGIAIGFLREIGEPDPPVSAFDLAAELGIAIVPDARITGARLIGDTIRLSDRADSKRRHWLVAHELGHYLLGRAGEPQSERGADDIAIALLLPRREFSLSLRSASWDLRLLQGLHRHCDVSLIARRIVDVREACVSAWSDGRIRSRWHSQGLATYIRKITDVEIDLAREAAETMQTVHAESLVWAVPAVCAKTGAVSVVTVADADQLALLLECRAQTA